MAVLAASSDASDSGSDSSQQPSLTSQQDDTDVWKWQEWANENGVVAPKLSVQEPLVEERGKGGVTALESIQALEVIARIPRELIVATCNMSSKAVEAAAEAKEFSWATDLTAATLAALHPTTSTDDLDETTKNYAVAKQSWIANLLCWNNSNKSSGGGWATDSADLGPPEAEWGPSCVTGSLMATGSDNDHNIYAKFRFPCHPVVHRAALGLAMLTGADEVVARDALYCRGRAFRAMRDALLPLVETPSSERKGSLRERRSWDVADVLSRVLSRATTLQLDLEQEHYCVVPLHERLAHCDARGENAKLVASSDNTQVLLVATRDIAMGEAITRNYATAPQLPEDTTEGALRLLLQFGLPPSAWETTTK